MTDIRPEAFRCTCCGGVMPKEGWHTVGYGGPDDIEVYCSGDCFTDHEDRACDCYEDEENEWTDA